MNRKGDASTDFERVETHEPEAEHLPDNRAAAAHICLSKHIRPPDPL